MFIESGMEKDLSLLTQLPPQNEVEMIPHQSVFQFNTNNTSVRRTKDQFRSDCLQMTNLNVSYWSLKFGNDSHDAFGVEKVQRSRIWTELSAIFYTGLSTVSASLFSYPKSPCSKTQKLLDS